MREEQCPKTEPKALEAISIIAWYMPPLPWDVALNA
jgi:hypothetical protein